MLNQPSNINQMPLFCMKKNEVQIAEEMFGLAKSIEQEKISTTVSGLIARKDPFEERRRRVNLILADMCFESKLRYIDHPNIDPAKHINRSKLHLNSHGDNILMDNLFKASKLRLNKNICNKRYEEDEIGVDAATISCTNAPFSSFKSGSCVGMGDETGTDKSAVLSGVVLPSSPRSDSCVGMEDGIAAGGAGVPCGGVPPPRPQILILLSMKIIAPMRNPAKSLIAINLRMKSLVTVLWR